MDKQQIRQELEKRERSICISLDRQMGYIGRYHMDRWTNRIDRQMERKTVENIKGQIVGQMDRQIDGQMVRRVDGNNEKWIDDQMVRWLDGQMVRWLEGQMEIMKDGQMII